MLVADLPVGSLEFANLNYDKNIHVKHVLLTVVFNMSGLDFAFCLADYEYTDKLSGLLLIGSLLFMLSLQFLL